MISIKQHLNLWKRNVEECFQDNRPQNHVIEIAAVGRRITTF